MFSTATTNPVLQAAWLLIGVMTVIFAVRALFALVPRAIPRALWRNKGTSVMTVIAAAATCVAVVAVGQRVGQPDPAPTRCRPPPCPPRRWPMTPRPGKVVFTFDDGPDTNTLAVISELNALHLQGVFFEIGDKVAGAPAGHRRRDRQRRGHRQPHLGPQVADREGHRQAAADPGAGP